MIDFVLGFLAGLVLLVCVGALRIARRTHATNSVQHVAENIVTIKQTGGPHAD